MSDPDTSSTKMGDDPRGARDGAVARAVGEKKTPAVVRPLVPVPTLDELATDPARAAGLSPEVVRALWLRCLAVQTALAPALVAAPGSEPQPAEDRLLDAREAARRLGMGTDWLYRRAGRLPFTVRQGRSVRFSSAKLEHYIRQRAGR